jgi:hypothetical protein
MRTLTPIELLEVWESGLECPPAERAIALVRATADESGDPARLPIGGRDARLLSLREQVFGPEIRGTVSCGDCGESMEVEFTVEGLRLPPTNAPARLTLEAGEYRLEFRLPDSLDLAALQHDGLGQEGGPRRALLDRCLHRATRLGEPVTAAELPEPVIAEIARAMASADPQAELELALQCSNCQRQWNEPFDIEPFLWHEIQAWAGRTLYEIHQLASAYGWNEREILSLSPVRRSAYLNLIADY